MSLRLLLTLLDFRRIPNYLASIIFAINKDILFYKRQFKGMLSLPEGVLLYKLASSLSDNSLILEIGCYGGLSAAFLLSGVRNKKSLLYSIDPFDKDIKGQKRMVQQYKDRTYGKVELSHIKNKPSEKAVQKQLVSRGLKNFELIKGYSYDVVKKWNKKIDLLWIDGNHDYKAVEKDFLDWSPFLKKGGIIAFHDANKKGKSKYWQWGWEGPKRVVDGYLKEPRWINLKKIDSIAYAEKNF